MSLATVGYGSMLDLMASVAEGVGGLKMRIVKSAAESEGLLLSGQNSDEHIETAISRVKELIPVASNDKSDDALRIELGDVYDTLPCSLRSHIVALGVLAYAEQLAIEAHNRVDGREAQAYLQSVLGNAFEDLDGIDGAL